MACSWNLPQPLPCIHSPATASYGTPVSLHPHPSSVLNNITEDTQGVQKEGWHFLVTRLHGRSWALIAVVYCLVVFDYITGQYLDLGDNGILQVLAITNKAFRNLSLSLWDKYLRAHITGGSAGWLAIPFTTPVALWCSFSTRCQHWVSCPARVGGFSLHFPWLMRLYTMRSCTIWGTFMLCSLFYLNDDFFFFF